MGEIGVCLCAITVPMRLWAICLALCKSCVMWLCAIILIIVTFCKGAMYFLAVLKGGLFGET